MRSMVLVVAVVTALYGGVCAAEVAKIAPDLLPSDTAAVVRIPSVPKARAALETSDLGAFWADPDVQLFLKPIWDVVLAHYGAAKKGNPALPALKDLDAVLTGELAFGVRLPAVPEGNPELYMVLGVGDAQAAARMLAPFLQGQALEEGKVIEIPGDGAPRFVLRKGLLLAATSATELDQMLTRLEKGGPALSANANWIKAHKMLDVADPMEVFADAAPFMKHLLLKVNEDDRPQTQTILQRLGFEGLQALLLQVGRRGPGVTLDTAIVHDAPKDSLLSRVLTPAPIPAETLRHVSAQSAFVSLSRVDLPGLLEAVRSVLDDNQRKGLQDGLAQVTEVLGFDLEMDFLPLLDEVWVLYDVGTRDVLGFYPSAVLSVGVKDAPKMEQRLAEIEKVSKTLAARLGTAAKTFDFSVKTLKLGATTVRYVDFAPVPLSPSIALVNGKLYLAPSFNTLRQALKQLPPAQSLVETAAFKETLTRTTGNADQQQLPGSFSYTNPMAKPASVSSLAQLLATGIGGAFRIMAAPNRAEEPAAEDPVVKKPPDLSTAFDFALFPSDETFQRYWRPSASVLVQVDGGSVLRREMPLPSMHNFVQGNTYVIPFAAGLMLPVLARAREAARRTSCASNLSQIYKGCVMFSDHPDNAGKLPPKLEDLFDGYVKDPRVFQCRSVPADKHGKGQGKVECCDYFYIPGNTVEQALNVVAFDRKHNHGRKGREGLGRNVLIVAGSVEFVASEKRFVKMLAATFLEQGLGPEMFSTAPVAPPNVVPAEELVQAVAAFADEDFEKRNNAAKLMSSAGEGARKALEEGATSRDPETNARCKELLKRLDDLKNKPTWVKELREELGVDSMKLLLEMMQDVEDDGDEDAEVMGKDE